MGGWMWFGWIGITLLVVVILWTVIRSVQQQNPPEDTPPRADTPEDELKRRYARGEIDRVEYERKLEDLRK
jgi:putative membrane protein